MEREIECATSPDADLEAGLAQGNADAGG